MQNVYDLAHEMARSLKETDQYINYKRCMDQINANEGLKKMIDDFQALNIQAQSAVMTGQQPDAELQQKLQSTYAIIMQDPTCSAFLNAQMAFSTVLSDIYQILGEAIDVK
jgi:cell fate (sporulation/competence/biofilm development) regulator YlbF (YheA/YmcA/DUF963 family)